MRAIIPVFQKNTKTPLYRQLYEYIKQEILAGEALPGEKLPSLRHLATQLEISLTTAELAYQQLVVEGYITSRPHAGYYVNAVNAHTAESPTQPAEPSAFPRGEFQPAEPKYLCDASCFDFVKWKKCMNRIINEHAELLLSESDTAGEASLREEIAAYVFRSRGVRCDADQIVTAAGTQQVIALLSNLFQHINLQNITVEDPGYLPVQNIFRDRGFHLTSIPVQKDGVVIEQLPSNIRCAAYVNPSNQFPTGAVMPIGRRYELLKWAQANNSYVIEDDYDSELRYFGKPIPSMQSLDKNGRVIYLGSFSSTVFAAIKISYVILPKPLARVFSEIGKGYSQTCSKTEQLTLALFMHQGYYQTGLRKMRRLYSQKLHHVVRAFKKCDFISVESSESGLNILIDVKSFKPAAKLCQEAVALGLLVQPVSRYSDGSGSASLIFYYNRIPLPDIDECLQTLIETWQK